MPDLSLKKFRANVTDFARPNRFWVSLGDIGLNDIAMFGLDNDAAALPWLEKHEFLAQSASLPGRAVGNITVNWQGMPYNIAGDPTFDEITLVFRNTYEFDLRRFFEAWLEVVSKMDSNERSQPGAYKSDVISLSQLGRTQRDILAVYKLIGGYPTNLAAVELSQDSNDTIEEISVTFKYDYFEVL